MPTRWWQRRGVVRASCPLCKQIFSRDFDLGTPGADFRDRYDDAARKVRDCAGDHMWYEHSGAFWGISWPEWDDRIRSLPVQGHWEEGSDGPGVGTVPLRSDFHGRPLQEEGSASASSPLAVHQAGPVGAGGMHDASLTQVALPEEHPSMMEVAVGVAPSPPAVGLPAAPSGSGCSSGAPAPLGEPRRAMTSPRGLRPGLSLTFSDRAPGLPSTQSPLPWRVRVAPGPPTWDPPAAPGPPPRRPPHGRIRQDVSPPRLRVQRGPARRRTRSREASRPSPARARSSSGSYERRRPASAARQGCSRGRSSGRRRAATVASASERGSSGGRAGRPRPVEAPSRREGAHPRSVPEAGRVRTEIRVLRHLPAEDLPLLLPPFLQTLSTQQLRSTVVLVMEEWIRREGR